MSALFRTRRQGRAGPISPVQNTMTSDPSDTRLLRLLAELELADVAGSGVNLAERLGRLIDFGDSMRLSAELDRIRRLQADPAAPEYDGGARQELLQLRLRLLQSVADSFAASARARIKLPMPDQGGAPEKLLTFEPYHRFYAAHQREFEARIQSLQLRVRERLSATSSALARLAALDEMLRDTLSLHLRRQLALLPQLLGRRFDRLLRERSGAADPAAPAPSWDNWARPGGGLQEFLHDMRGLLLAELELRLLPVLGLLEAVDEEVAIR